MSTYLFDRSDFDTGIIKRKLHYNKKIETKFLNYIDPIEGYITFLNDLQTYKPQIQSYILSVPTLNSCIMSLKLQCVTNSVEADITYTFVGDYTNQLSHLYWTLTREYLYKL